MKSSFALLVSSAVVCLNVPSAVAAEVAEKLPPGAKIVRLEAQPSAIELRGPYAYAQLIVTGTLASGERIDVTRLAHLTHPAQVRLGHTGLVRPAADGEGVLQVSLQEQRLCVHVHVSGQKAKTTVSFVRDVMPTLSRLGCNAGTCHGSAEGKNGFKLSLRGYDSLADHRALTDDLEGRRFNRAAPDTSLMLLKCSGAVPHVGGVLTQPGEPYYEMLRAWIADGVQFDSDTTRVSSIRLLPASMTIPLPGMKQQVAVLATYADGSVRDVSVEAFVESSNTEVATVDRQGTVTAVRRGEATIMARYEGTYAAAPLVVMGDRSGFSWREAPEYNYIDKLVYEKLRQLKILPAEVCSDAEFVRRVYLDLVGLPPQPDQVRAFVADTRPGRAKREELVEQLLGSPDFVEHWTNKWADLLQVNRKFLGEQGAAAFRDWIRKAVAENMPYDKFVLAILTASGSNLRNPPASYYKVLREPGPALENTTQLFLAIRFNCNKCHDHPFERWNQNQYYEMAAFFAQIGRTEDPHFKGQRIGGTDVEAAKPLAELISDTSSGEVTHLRTGQVSPPRFAYVHADMPSSKLPRREQLARWLTSRQNPYFARSYVNRLWSYLLGVGLIEPVDDIRASNPPSNPRLLDALTRDFMDSGFDTRHMLRTICQSRVYQHSITANEWNKDDETNYSHAVARRLPAEVLYDAIERVTGSVSHLPGLPPGSRAAQLLDSAQDIPGGFFNLFGKPPRESACECERTKTLMLGPVLNLVNGPVVAEAVKDPGNRIARLVRSVKDDRQLIEELYLAVLCRQPTSAEMQASLAALRNGVEDYEHALAEHQRLSAELATYTKLLDARQPQWETRMKTPPVWSVVEVIRAGATGGATLSKQWDGSILAKEKNRAPETYFVTARTKLPSITAIRLEVLADLRLPAFGPGRAPNGNFVLNEFQFLAQPKGCTTEVQPLPLQHAHATFSQEGFPVAAAIDGNPATGWAIAPKTSRAQTAYFELKTPLSNADQARLTFSLLQQYPGGKHNIGRFRLSVTSAPVPLEHGQLPKPVYEALQIEPARRSAGQQAELTNFYRTQDPEWIRRSQALAQCPRPVDRRQPGAQDVVWALINSKAFQFNH